MNYNRKRTIQSITLILMVILFASCTTAPRNLTPLAPDDLKKPSESESIVYLYRHQAFNSIQPGASPVVKLDGEKLGLLGYGGYLEFSVEPGFHRLDFGGFWWATVDTQSIEFYVDGSERIYLRFVSGGKQVLSSLWEKGRIAGVVKVDEPTGLAEMSTLLYYRPEKRTEKE